MNNYGPCPTCNQELDEQRECKRCGLRETTTDVNKTWRTFEPLSVQQMLADLPTAIVSFSRE